MNSAFINEQMNAKKSEHEERRNLKKKQKIEAGQISCMEADAMVKDFIADQLPPEESKLYLDHIDHCKDCYENLEMVYMIRHTLAYLDEDESEGFSVNLQNLLSNEIQKHRNRIIGLEHKRQANVYIFVVMVFMVVMMMMDFLGIVPLTRLI